MEANADPLSLILSKVKRSLDTGLPPSQHPLTDRPVFQEFLEDYFHRRHARDAVESELAELLLPQLYLLDATVKAMGGLIEVISHGKWPLTIYAFQRSCISKVFCSTPKLQLSLVDWFRVYCRLLFEYEAGYSLERTILPDSVIKVPLFLEDPKWLQATPTSAIWDQEICVIRNGVAKLGLTHVNITEIGRRYGHCQTDARIQRPADVGFNAQKLLNVPIQITVREYLDYQQGRTVSANIHQALNDSKLTNDFRVQAEEKTQTRNSSLLPGKQSKDRQSLSQSEGSPEKILFGVNFEPDDKWFDHELTEKLKGTCIESKGINDLLSYLDDNVPGCSQPQFYFKVKGCWTGGHQENSALCAVNLNHGPHPSEWLSIAQEHVEVLRAALKTSRPMDAEYNLDLYSEEGLWFERVEWFIRRGFPITRLVQSKGDIVLSGPGTLHWVRSLGTSMHSAWNLMPKTPFQISAALHRYRQNELINFSRISTIQLKAILLKYLLHEDIPEVTRIQIVQQLQGWLSQEKASLEKLSERGTMRVEVCHLRDYQSICESCTFQVFMYYMSSPTAPGIICLACAANHYAMNVPSKKKRPKSKLISQGLHTDKAEVSGNALPMSLSDRNRQNSKQARDNFGPTKTTSAFNILAKYPLKQLESVLSSTSDSSRVQPIRSSLCFNHYIGLTPCQCISSAPQETRPASMQNSTAEPVVDSEQTSKAEQRRDLQKKPSSSRGDIIECLSDVPSEDDDGYNTPTFRSPDELTVCNSKDEGPQEIKPRTKPSKVRIIDHEELGSLAQRIEYSSSQSVVSDASAGSQTSTKRRSSPNSFKLQRKQEDQQHPSRNIASRDESDIRSPSKKSTGRKAKAKKSPKQAIRNSSLKQSGSKSTRVPSSEMGSTPRQANQEKSSICMAQPVQNNDQAPNSERAWDSRKQKSKSPNKARKTNLKQSKQTKKK